MLHVEAKGTWSCLCKQRIFYQQHRHLVTISLDSCIRKDAEIEQRVSFGEAIVDCEGNLRLELVNEKNNCMSLTVNL
jgi:hypothetical protein